MCLEVTFTILRIKRILEDGAYATTTTTISIFNEML